MRPLARFASFLGLASCLIVLLAGPAYRLGLVDLELALLRGFRLAAALGLGAVAIGLIALLARLWQRRVAVGTACLAVGLGLAGLAVPVGMRIQAERVPMIHEASTDLADPPRFEAILPLRAGAPNAAAFDPTIAPLQREAYPDLQPIRLREPRDRVFEAAVALIDRLGWDRVAVDRAEGRIEATDTSLWFGFVDDIAIRIRRVGGVTVVDARSKSRVGRSDLGKNAERLRAFRHALLSSLTSGEAPS